MPSEFEKRRYPRADLVFKLKYFQDQGSSWSAVTKDISEGGVSFETKTLQTEGSELTLAFALEGLQGEIVARGQVIRSWEESGRHYTAVLFTKIDESDREIIYQYIHDHMESA